MFLLLRICFALLKKRPHDHGNTYKENIELGMTYSSRGLVQVFCGGMQIDMVLEKEPKVLYLDPQSAGRKLT